MREMPAAMKLGIDLYDVRADMAGGKDAVPMNLVRGFVSLGHAENIVCFCRKELVPALEGISDRLAIVLLPESGSSAGAIRFLGRAFAGRRLRRLAVAAGVDVLLFTNKYTPNTRFPMKTAMITHDIQCFAAPQAKLSFSSALRRFKAQLQIRNDFRNRDLIIAISDFDASMCRDHFPEYSGKIRRIYNPVSVPGTSATAQKDVSTFPAQLSGKYITALNIQWKHKNTMTLIKAFERIRDSVPLDLILVGKLPQDAAVMTDYVREHRLGDRVSFTGLVSEEELDRIITETRIYVNPSSFEGFGLTAVEMLIRGIPSIVADCTASPETTRGFAAVYSPPGDDLALSEMILREWKDPVPAEQRLAASVKLKNLYDVDTIAAQYWAAVTDLARRQEPPVSGPSSIIY